MKFEPTKKTNKKIELSYILDEISTVYILTVVAFYFMQNIYVQDKSIMTPGVYFNGASPNYPFFRFKLI